MMSSRTSTFGRIEQVAVEVDRRLIDTAFESCTGGTLADHFGVVVEDSVVSDHDGLADVVAHNAVRVPLIHICGAHPRLLSGGAHVVLLRLRPQRGR